MSFKLLHRITKSYRNLSLQNIITLPFLLQIFITVSLVGYFSWRNGEQAVNNVTRQLRSEVTAGVKQHLKDYLKTPHLIVRLKQNSLRTEQLNIDNFPAIRQDFWSTIQLLDTVRAIYLGDETGKFIYTKQEADKLYSKEVERSPRRETYLLDNLGQKQALVIVDEYDPRLRPWYIKTLETQRNNWSEIYTFTGGELGITAAGLLRDSQGEFQGIIGVDLVLSGIDRFLQNIEISENGQVFILEQNGYLVATSTKEQPFTYDPTTDRERRLRGIDSQSLLVKETTAHITQHFRSLYSIKDSTQLEYKLNNENQLVQIVPYQDDLGLDWLIVVVMPEADFMGEIEANTLNTIWLCLTALAIATICGIYTSRRIAQPITKLSDVTSIIAKSAKAKNTSTSLYPVIKAKNTKELRSLAESFNEMVIQLKYAFRELENANTTLENRVQQRTEDLAIALEAADTANLAKSEFLAKMSHELRTPLHAILGFTQVALQDDSLSPQKKENLLTVKRSGEHLLTLIDDLLKMSQIEAGLLSTNLKFFDLHLLLSNLAKMFQLKASAKNISLTFNLPPSLPQQIKTDPVKLNQILINLIDNGIKFSDQGEVSLNLKLLTKGDSAFLAFAIADTGHGISPSQLKSIFVPFVHTQYSDLSGTGLGLSICQQFVLLLGGEITVTSKLGQGSVFRFQIPIKIAPQPDNSPTAVQQLNFTPSKTRTLSKSDLAKMPPEWIEKLRYAAIAVDRELLIQLIADIPGDRSILAEALTELTNNYCFDEIIDLTET